MGRKQTGALLAQLRSLMKSSPYSPKGLHAYIIPTDDAHQSEYIADCDKRRAFISGFTGSAGTAIVTEDHAALWTDGRYYLQAQDELDENWTLMRAGLKNTLSQAAWLKKVLPSGCVVGVDPSLLSASAWKPLEEELVEGDIKLLGVPHNLVDTMWGEDRPPPPNKPVFIQPHQFTGRSWQEKVNDVRNKMKEKDASTLLVTALDDVAWLFNLRGSDIEYNPVFFAYGIVTMYRVFLFIDDCKLSPEVLKHLQEGTQPSVEILPYGAVQCHLKEIIQTTFAKVWVSKSSSYALYNTVPKKFHISEATPIALMKCVKNPVEIEGMKRAHVKDAVALCQFMHWMEQEVPKGDVSEMTAAAKCLEFREKQKDFVSLSFETISAVGPHAAVIHYRVTPESDARVAMDKVYLCDSGAQFKDGTTDVTRTVHFADPTSFEKEAFTRVLKGHISLASLVFPNGVKGGMMDSFARASLWEAGLDYLHGTGHGVGSFLACHEGPCSISFRVKPDEVPLEEGMVVSDEPGYYEDRKFGIRIESLILVKAAKTENNFQKRGFLCFEPITLVPIQQSMIIPELLTEKEVSWVNDYHKKCMDVVGQELKEQGHWITLEWLEKQTQPLG